jgi:hypothetical protein
MCAEKLGTAEEVHQVEISLLSVATAHSTGTGQGFHKCHVKASANQRSVSLSEYLLCITQSAILINHLASNDNLLV